ncbi:Hypothetical protein ABZS17G119_03804 [Kosakonia cowanii]
MAARLILTHIRYALDQGMMKNPLPTGPEAGYDGLRIVLD